MNKHAQALGRIKTPKKARASRLNGKLGGRPKYTGKMKERLYRIYHRMNDRCINEKSFSFSMYGAKGIKNLWESYEDFKNDMSESYNEHIKNYGEENTQLDRIDNSGNYCQENCHWATRKENNRNENNNAFMTYKGETKTKAEWAELLGIPYANFLGYARTRTIEEIINYKRLFLDKNSETIPNKLPPLQTQR